MNLFPLFLPCLGHKCPRPAGCGRFSSGDSCNLTINKWLREGASYSAIWFLHEPVGIYLQNLKRISYLTQRVPPRLNGYLTIKFCLALKSLVNFK